MSDIFPANWLVGGVSIPALVMTHQTRYEIHGFVMLMTTPERERYNQVLHESILPMPGSDPVQMVMGCATELDETIQRVDPSYEAITPFIRFHQMAMAHLRGVIDIRRDVVRNIILNWSTPLILELEYSHNQGYSELFITTIPQHRILTLKINGIELVLHDDLSVKAQFEYIDTNLQVHVVRWTNDDRIIGDDEPEQ